ncbi:Uncharacterised protein [Candidatus Bilamarchaeum dharawalense]|uniref:Uncharacterized protein n=1 Tax=Candidatus Bilamarchaeum dharawalense TaxID=2885759 RepID=A0A5E4LTR4_9ARCH|nr:Uncharacterised protein [Candidatus Bilamarchaeum dharawalense]
MSNQVTEWLQTLKELDELAKNKKAAANGSQPVITNDTNKTSI